MSKRPSTVCIIHHSHTDIGYTETQQRITRWHVDFIRQALECVRDAPGFKWTCETFWAVERFLERATDTEVETFTSALVDGHIGLSANYLNLTELVDYPLLQRVVGRAGEFGRTVEVPVDCAMTADINGHGWGFAQALHDNGVHNLFTCVHTHHGMYPLGRTQVPFWWETPEGDRILVWNGEHYHYGNELGMVPGAVSSYLIKDECDADMVYHDHWGVAEIRIPRYLDALAESGYAFDVAPVMASGLRTDNAPPSAKIMDFVSRWNREHGDVARVEMVTLGEFFQRLRAENLDQLPAYRGDWPDWWSDGVASAPAAVKMFREAQREREYLRVMSEGSTLAVNFDPIDRDLVMFAEHTFSHSDAMSQPWFPLAQAISARKQAFAASALEHTQREIDDALEQIGATTLTADMPLRFRVINPLPRAVSGIARVPVSHFEYHELNLHKGAEVVDESGTVLPRQLQLVPRGAEYCVHVTLEAEMSLDLELRAVAGAQVVATSADRLETPFVRIDWAHGEGIIAWRDKTTDRDLLRADRAHSPFAVVYEVTPVADRGEICSVRGAMDLNRKGSDVRRSVAKLTGVSRIEIGDVLAIAELDYEVAGLRMCTVELSAYQNEPRVDVAVRVHKESRWEPENVYIALPFSSGIGQLWLDKAGARIRPRIDQIPGTLTDFCAVQGGLAHCGNGFSVVVATPDTPLIQLGSLEHGPRPLAGDASLEGVDPHAYAWAMTNYWETNFGADLGGFYEFRYRVVWGEKLATSGIALDRCRDISHEIRCFRLRR